MAVGEDFTLNWNGDDFMKRAQLVGRAAMLDAAFLVERDVKNSFGKGASRPDKKVRRSKGKRGKFHRPSAPGYPPNIDTGLLKSSIGHEIVSTGDWVDGWVGALATIKYALALELGYAARNLAPRPYLRPAMTRNALKILAIFKRSYR